MLLSDRDINSEIDNGELVIVPQLEARRIQPASVDLTLGRSLRLFNSTWNGCIDPRSRQDLTYEVTLLERGQFMVRPYGFLLATTAERVELSSSLAGRLEGVSSLGRLGLLVHSTAGFVDPGFQGQITLELSNMTGLPILIYPGMRIAQLCLFKLSSPAIRPYGSPGLSSKYQNQAGTVSSLSWMDKV